MTARRRIVRPRAGRIAAVAAVLGLSAYGVPAVVLAGEVPPRTTAAGVDIGGLSPARARARLEEAFARPGRMALAAPGRTVTVAPADLGLALDATATVAAAMDGVSTPAGVARGLLGSRALPPRVRVDERLLARKVAALARAVDRAPREGGVRYVGLEPRPVPPEAGRALNRAAAARAIRDAFLARRARVALPVRPLAPSVTAEKARAAAATARAAVAAPLTLTAGGRRATLSRARLAAHLRFVADGRGGLRPSFDAREVAAELRDELVPAAERPEDAGFTIAKGRPAVVPGRAGSGLDPAAVSAAVSAALASGSRTAGVALSRVEPALTTERARALGVREKVSSFTTRHPCCAPRVTNIHRIADLVDGHVVRPGATFSLNGLVGRRDRERGFVEAPMILNGRFVDDVGGGVSQFATTMFNAVFFGGFEDVRHTPHQFYISRYPAGRESTVSFPQPDFRWRNDSPYGVLIRTSYTSTSVTVEFWSTKRYDVESRSSARYAVKDFPTLTDSGPDCLPMGGVQGFAIDVWRIFRTGGEVVRRQRFHTVYAPEPRLTCT
ncbi:VanW family protein [Nonomuraea roseoviolacea]|uniref:Vancomycin resistance protein YoaR n=1 Tax=Nonomuraea roseoviolacea subsp. carminata TaxID=160689 RepID=A0ABT1JY10_9ACTN|nr:VanW family protein [Nonomuraea roseoviolacea]MCP2346495.1 vancomycin resistance protein YoaR [Nonomuraea roseoviolacea subsp. carminata]